MLSFFNRVIARIWAVFHASQFDQELDAELESHIELRTEDLIRQGMQPEQAKRAARIDLGGVTQLHEAHREARGLPFVEKFVMDFADVPRQLRASPVFSIAAVLTLATGIGANTAIFSLVDQLILRLLPVQDPQRVAALVGTGEFYGDSQGTNPVSYPMYQELRDHNQVFSQMMCRRPQDFTVATSSESAIASGELVSGNYFPILGIRPALGRLFQPKVARRSWPLTSRPGARPLTIPCRPYATSKLHTRT